MMKTLLAGLTLALCSQLATAKEVVIEIDSLDFEDTEFQEALDMLAATDPLEVEKLLADLKDIKKHKKPAGVIGILFDSTEDGQVKVTKVMPGGAAEEAGLLAGDLIVVVNGKDVNKDDGSGDAMRSAMNSFGYPEPGDKITMVVERKGKRLEKAMITKARTSEFAAFSEVHKEIEKILQHKGYPGAVLALHSRDRVGLEMANLNEGLGKYFGADNGVLVINTGDDNIYQLQPGDVIVDIGGRTAKSPRWVTNLLFTYGPGDKLSIGIMRDKKKRTLKVTVPEE
ncbi:PDZ domain-containing protein [Porticoccus sp. W117]|uniref:PDZ domain-containing protein n=1 Tax=Porticoccus sp. W117 TaxID=3054777 RepID=UPI0025939ED8|nr:PDZ domain-containing protein [Porticoccus sp. W117]MDM3872542.1 PDZ domain-containing protein [Porticoccus sp. W117]